ncbi:MAG: hypothetical protein M1830_002917 [Pleopsidium flavum]|nr:MAG: hypothetical protein M1830_002917 [Pleopsidium flavum]
MATQESFTSPQSTTQIFEHLEAYSWSEDAEFQGGLTAILGPNPSPEQADELTLRARCFYYARKFDVPIDFSAYKTWRLQHQPSSINAHVAATNGTLTNYPSPLDSVTTTLPSTNPPAPYPPTFSQIVDLITTGQPIPGIKDIPDTVLAGQETQTTTAKRSKPWEKDDINLGVEENGETPVREHS